MHLQNKATIVATMELENYANAELSIEGVGGVDVVSIRSALHQSTPPTLSGSGKVD